MFEEIVVATDFSEHSLRAVDYAAEIAEKFGSHVTLIHVVEPVLLAADLAWTTVDFEEIHRSHREMAEEQVERIAQERFRKEVSCETRVLFGKPFVGILRFAKDRRADLIVMASHGRGAISHLLMGSTAEKVVRKASSSVLTVKHPEYVFAMP